MENHGRVKCNEMPERKGDDFRSKRDFDSIRKRWATVDEVADYLKVAKKTIYSWVSQGVIPCIRKDRRIVRFKLNKIDDWLARYEQTGRATRWIPVEPNN